MNVCFQEKGLGSNPSLSAILANFLSNNSNLVGTAKISLILIISLFAVFAAISYTIPALAEDPKIPAVLCFPPDTGENCKYLWNSGCTNDGECQATACVDWEQDSNSDDYLWGGGDCAGVDGDNTGTGYCEYNHLTLDAGACTVDCSSYEAELDCLGAICYWCVSCSGYNIFNGNYQCVNSELDCSYNGCDIATCGAECESDSDCPCPSDGCEGDYFLDYPDNGYCGEGCLCQNDTQIKGECLLLSSSCSQSECGAECDEDSDCSLYYSEGDYCYYSGSCDFDCTCSHEEDYCPEPGTEDNGICYYGTKDCDAEGCTLNEEAMECRTYCNATEGPQDILGPVTSNVAVHPLYNNGIFNVTATVQDTCSNIQAAEYFVRKESDSRMCGTPGTGTVMYAVDKAFDELTEDVRADYVEWLYDGTNKICVQSKDEAGNWGNCACIYYSSDTIPPEFIGDLELNGVTNPDELLVCGIDPNLTVTVCDTQSDIQGGEYFLNLISEPEFLCPVPYPAPFDGFWLEPINDYIGINGRHCSEIQGFIDLAPLAEGTHRITNIRGKDIVENWGKLCGQNFSYSFIKDTTPPKTYKELLPAGDISIGCDIQSANGHDITDKCYYVKQGTQVKLDAYDFNPDDDTDEGYNDLPGEYADEVVIYYKVWWSEDCKTNWILDQQGQSNPNDPVTITLDEDSCHLIEYWSVDLCGEEEKHHFELDIVDTKAPNTTKTVSEPKVAGTAPIDWYIKSNTEIELTCVDQDPHPVDDVTLYWELYWSEDCECPWEPIDSGKTDGYKLITGLKNSCHKLVYWCEDALGNVEEKQTEIDAVDNQEPKVNKSVSEPKVLADASWYDEVYNLYGHIYQYEIRDPAWFITQDTNITLTCEDILPHPVGNVTIYYTYYVDGVLHQDWTEYTEPIQYNEDTYHQLYYYCIDELGNGGEMHYELDIVDTQKPVSWKEVGTSSRPVDLECNPKEEDCDYYVTQDTQIDLNCIDYGPHPVDNVTLHYKIEWKENEGDEWVELENGTVGNYYGFKYENDSYHRLTWYCVDELGNKEEEHVELDIVDTKPPVIEKIVTEPKVAGTEPIHWYLTDESIIKLNCTDQQPHPVDDVTLYWDLYWSEYCIDPEWELINSGKTIGYDEITGLKNSCHKLVYWCEDALGNVEEKQTEIDAVDNQEPNSWKELTGKQIECTENEKELYGIGDCAYITQNTLVELTCEDQLPHPVDNVTLHYKIEWKEYWEDSWIEIDSGHNGGYINFTYENDSYHRLTWYCVDELGNKEEEHVELDIVDTQAPVGEKVIGEPKLTCTIEDDFLPLQLFGEELPERKGDEYQGGGLLSELLSTGSGPCDSATQPEQCAYVASNSLPPFVYATATAQGADSALLAGDCGNILILSSGNPVDSDDYLSYSWGNPGCGTNPDGYSTYDCVTLDFTPAGDSLVLALSSEWPEYYYSSYTDWMRIGGIVDDSIEDWEPDTTPPHNNVIEIAYGPSTTGTVTLATISQGSEVELRVADSGDSVLDTAMIVIPVSCFEETGGTLLCGNGELEPGEECDDGNKVSGDGCSSICLIEDNQTPQGPDCWWVRDHVTEINLTCTDQDPHPIGREEICYKVSWDVEPWLTGQYCKISGGQMEEDWCCADASLGKVYTIVFEEDSVHDLEYYCRDALENENEVDLEYFKVDSQPPVTDKTFDGPTYPASGYDMEKFQLTEEEAENFWIMDHNTTINLDAVDQAEPCDVGVKEIYYRIGKCEELPNGVVISANGDGLCAMGEWVVVPGDHADFTIDEDCLHVIEWYAVDELGNEEKPHYQYHRVDSTPPESWKEIEGPVYAASEEDIEKFNLQTEEEIANFWLRDHDTWVIIDSEDKLDPCAVGLDYVHIELWWDSNGDDVVDTMRWEENVEPESLPYEFQIEEDCLHLIKWYGVDLLGNKEETHYQYHRVDSTPPKSTKIFEGPTCGEDLDQNGTIEGEAEENYWVTSDTQITLTAIDQAEPCAVGVDYLYYELWWDSNADGEVDTLLESGTAPGSEVTFNFEEECLHEIRWYSVDYLGNVDQEELPTKATIFFEGFSDQFGGHYTLGKGEQLVESFSTLGYDNIELTYSRKAWFLEKGDLLKVEWRVGDEGEWTPLETVWNEDWDTLTWDLTGAEDQELIQVRFYADFSSYSCFDWDWAIIDNVKVTGETYMHIQQHRVDNTPPVIIKEVGWPSNYWGKDPETEEDVWDITTETEISILEPVDQKEPCAVGGVEIKYSIWYDLTGEWSEWYEYTGPFTFYGDSTHRLNITVTDCLGNSASDVETFIVHENYPGDPCIIPRDLEVLGPEWKSFELPAMLIDMYTEDNRVWNVLKLIEGEYEIIYFQDYLTGEWTSFDPSRLDEVTGEPINSLVDFGSSHPGRYWIKMVGPTSSRGYLPIFNDLKEGCEMEFSECWDRLDNDEDGYWDFDYDTGCESETDDEEALCGDGYLDFEEECDSNGDNGEECIPEYGSSCDYCSLTCTIETLQGDYCGDGTLNGPEECDQGGANGMECQTEYGSSCDYCSETCELVTVDGGFCGDSIINGDEDCDGSNEGCDEGFICESCNCIPPGPV